MLKKPEVGMSNKLVSPKSVRKIRVVGEDGRSVVIHKRKGKKKKKQSGPLKPFERAQRRMAKAVKKGTGKYLSKHRRSNRKKRDGWAKDFMSNVAKSNRASMKVARKALPRI